MALGLSKELLFSPHSWWLCAVLLPLKALLPGSGSFMSTWPVLFLASYGNAPDVLATHAGKISLTGTSGLGFGHIRRRIW